MIDVVLIFIVIVVAVLGWSFLAIIKSSVNEENKDDGKFIKDKVNMEIHCKVVSKDKDFYWNTGLECAVCAYREDCKRYVIRYGKYPNGEAK
jgi:hypothetical protein